MSIELTSQAVAHINTLMQSENRNASDTYVRINNNAGHLAEDEGLSGAVCNSDGSCSTHAGTCNIEFVSHFDEKNEWLFDNYGLKVVVDKKMFAGKLSGLGVSYDQMNGFKFVPVEKDSSSCGCSAKKPVSSCGCSDGACDGPVVPHGQEVGTTATMI